MTKPSYGTCWRFTNTPNSVSSSLGTNWLPIRPSIRLCIRQKIVPCRKIVRCLVVVAHPLNFVSLNSLQIQGTLAYSSAYRMPRIQLEQNLGENGNRNNYTEP